MYVQVTFDVDNLQIRNHRELNAAMNFVFEPTRAN